MALSRLYISPHSTECWSQGSKSEITSSENNTIECQPYAYDILLSAVEQRPLESVNRNTRQTERGLFSTVLKDDSVITVS